MVRDTSASDAIALGMAIVRAIDGRERFPTVRVGMSTGEAVERDGDWFGSTVNLAARISAAAGGSEVLVSEATREAAGGMDGVELHRHGEVRLRGVPKPVMLYRALRAGERVGELAIDPVCRMKIDPGAGAGELTHEGVEYHFCSLHCAAQFADNPERYVG
jgi:adenylate cyclase